MTKRFLDLNVPGFVRLVVDTLEKHSITVSDLYLDHVCYRCSTLEEYTRWKQELSAIASLLIESLVGGRLIATYKLLEPIHVDGRDISVIELPSPKHSSHYDSGLEHAEFVINVPLEEFMKQHPLDWNTAGLNKQTNADIRADFDGFSVKFHLQPLETVIEQEKQ
jgi:predicted metalloenzyme YecM